MFFVYFSRSQQEMMMEMKTKDFFGMLLLAFLAMSFIGCSSSRYAVYQFDNGDDYFCDGLQRIVDRHGRIGYVDEHGKL